MVSVVDWIKASPPIMFIETKEFGDPDFEKDCHLLLQKCIRGSLTNKGITVQRIGVPKNQRRKGKATKMLDIIEQTAKECGLQFVLIQCVSTDAMVELIMKRKGYEHLNYFFDETEVMGDYIKFL
jgi:hypothetical protein